MSGSSYQKIGPGSFFFPWIFIQDLWLGERVETTGITAHAAEMVVLYEAVKAASQKEGDQHMFTDRYWSITVCDDHTTT